MGTKTNLRMAALVVLSVLFMFPLVWIFFTSLKSELEVRSALQLLPRQWLWNNYVKAWQASNFARQFLNSFVVALSVTCGQILTSFLAGYVFARLRFKMRKVLFTAFIATLIVPYQLLVLPIFVMFSRLGWIDTYAALILPTLVNAFGIYLFKQHFESLPASLEESAQLDGASRWKTLWDILFPLSRSPAVTLFLLTFIFEWNDLFKPLIFTQSAGMRTVQLGLMAFQEQFKTSYSLLTAAVVFVSVPVILLFFVGQRRFIQGIAASGVKEF